MTTKPEVCGTCGSDTPHLLLKSCAFAHDIPGSGMPDAFHAKPAERLGRCGTCGERGPCRHDAKPADATGEMSDGEINAFLADGRLCVLAFGHNCGGKVSMCSPAFHHVFAEKARALLAEMGERVIVEFDTMHAESEMPTSSWKWATDLIRRLMGVKP